MPPFASVLVMGSILGCRKAALAMAAGMSTGRSPFLRVDSNSRPGNDNEKSSIEEMKNERILEERKALIAKVGNSDHALLGMLACLSVLVHDWMSFSGYN